jgi:hypothetical protein
MHLSKQLRAANQGSGASTELHISIKAHPLFSWTEKCEVLLSYRDGRYETGLGQPLLGGHLGSVLAPVK